MRVHGDLFDPNIQLNALYESEAKREAEMVRKKLQTSAAVLKGESSEEGDCVVSLSEDDARKQQASQEDEQKRDEVSAAADSDSHPDSDTFNDWA
jgi:hypothetical protein